MKNKDYTPVRREKTEKTKKNEKRFTVIALILIAVTVLFAVGAILFAVLGQAAREKADASRKSDEELLVGCWYAEIDGMDTCWRFEKETAYRYMKNGETGGYEETERLSYLLNTALRRMIFISGQKRSAPFDYSVTETTLVISYNNKTITFTRGEEVC